MTKIIVAFLFVFFVTSIDIQVNNQTLIKQQPKLIAQVTNGQKLLIGDLNDPQRNILYIANLKGTPFQMGEAYGKLFKEEIKEMMDMFYTYYVPLYQQQLEKNLPKFIVQKIPAKTALRTALQLDVLVTKKYTNSRYYQQIAGIAKGSGVQAGELDKLNIFPQFVKAACTVAGLWGQATNSSKTLHMRALDWDYKSPFNKYPIVTVYHPSNKKYHTHANFFYVGLIGSLTGMSTKVSIGQKVWIPSKGTIPTTRYGNPWTYALRDVLYDASNLQTAIKILQDTHRTCTIHVGLGSVQDKSFRMMEYSFENLNVYDDKNYTHYGANHPKMPGVAYFDKHVQPSPDSTVGFVLTHPSLYGNWEMQSFWRTLGMTHQTGNTQLVVFDLQDQQVLISYCQYKGVKKAFQRSPIYLNMAQLFKPF